MICIANRDLRFHRATVLFFAVVLGATARADPSLVIHHAKVVTVDQGFTIAEAVVIEGDKIEAVGDNAECLRRAGPKTRLIDAGGKMVLPGLYDSHVHSYSACVTELQGKPPPFESITQLQEYIRVEAKNKAEGEWIVFGPAFPTRLKEGRLPTRAELDAAAPKHPVLWIAQPLAVTNTQGLKISGITKDTPNPLPGTLDRDPGTGEPTGVLRSATSVLKNLPPDPTFTTAQRRKALKHLLSLYNQYGITAIGERAADGPAIDLFRDLAAKGELTVRVNCTRITSAGQAERQWEVSARKVQDLVSGGTDRSPHGPTGAGDDWVRVGPLKVLLDGGMLSGTAYMREPWGIGPTYQITDPKYRGQLRQDLAGLRVLFQEAARAGWQLTAHCAGEGALEELLEIYASIHRQADIRRRRMLITHANFASADQLRRCRELGICADIQPAWLYLDADSLTRTLGSRRMRDFLPLKSWLKATTAGGGSDHMTGLSPNASINPWNPWLGLSIAVTRKTQGGNVVAADECLSRAEAIRLYTINNAYLHFQDEKIGSLEKGKYADLILIDRDVLTCPADDIRDTRVLLTVVNGRIVAER